MSFSSSDEEEICELRKLESDSSGSDSELLEGGGLAGLTTQTHIIAAPLPSSLQPSATSSTPFRAPSAPSTAAASSSFSALGTPSASRDVSDVSNSSVLSSGASTFSTPDSTSTALLSMSSNSSASSSSASSSSESQRRSSARRRLRSVQGQESAKTQLLYEEQEAAAQYERKRRKETRADNAVRASHFGGVQNYKKLQEESMSKADLEEQQRLFAMIESTGGIKAQMQQRIKEKSEQQASTTTSNTGAAAAAAGATGFTGDDAMDLTAAAGVDSTPSLSGKGEAVFVRASSGDLSSAFASTIRSDCGGFVGALAKASSTPTGRRMALCGGWVLQYYAPITRRQPPLDLCEWLFKVAVGDTCINTATAAFNTLEQLCAHGCWRLPVAHVVQVVLSAGATRETLFPPAYAEVVAGAPQHTASQRSSSSSRSRSYCSISNSGSSNDSGAGEATKTQASLSKDAAERLRMALALLAASCVGSAVSSLTVEDAGDDVGPSKYETVDLRTAFVATLRLSLDRRLHVASPTVGAVISQLLTALLGCLDPSDESEIAWFARALVDAATDHADQLRLLMRLPQHGLHARKVRRLACLSLIYSIAKTATKGPDTPPPPPPLAADLDGGTRATAVLKALRSVSIGEETDYCKLYTLTYLASTLVPFELPVAKTDGSTVRDLDDCLCAWTRRINEAQGMHGDRSLAKVRSGSSRHTISQQPSPLFLGQQHEIPLHPCLRRPLICLLLVVLYIFPPCSGGAFLFYLSFLRCC